MLQEALLHLMKGVKGALGTPSGRPRGKAVHVGITFNLCSQACCQMSPDIGQNSQGGGGGIILGGSFA